MITDLGPRREVRVQLGPRTLKKCPSPPTKEINIGHKSGVLRPQLKDNQPNILMRRGPSGKDRDSYNTTARVRQKRTTTRCNGDCHQLNELMLEPDIRTLELQTKEEDEDRLGIVQWKKTRLSSKETQRPSVRKDRTLY